MALHSDFPASPYFILDPALRWFPAKEALRETSMQKLMPPLVGPSNAAPCLPPIVGWCLPGIVGSWLPLALTGHAFSSGNQRRR